MTDQQPTPEFDDEPTEAEKAYFAQDGKITLMFFLVESYSQPDFRAGLKARGDEGTPESLLPQIHRALALFTWHFDSHGDDPEYGLVGINPRGAFFEVQKTRKEWNSLLMEAHEHKEAENALMGLFALMGGDQQ